MIVAMQNDILNQGVVFDVDYNTGRVEFYLYCEPKE